MSLSLEMVEPCLFSPAELVDWLGFMKGEEFRSGYVTILGRPNVGKSTLINRVLGEKIAVITEKPQTTRHRILGVLTSPASQLILLDTPGIHRARSALNLAMVDTAIAALGEADVVCFLIDGTDPSGPGTRHLAGQLESSKAPTVAAINKIDLLGDEGLRSVMDKVRSMGTYTDVIPVSALTGQGMKRLVRALEELLPPGPKYFPDDQLTDLSLRFLTQEIIREKIMLLTEQEIPYAAAVEVTEFTEPKKEGTTRIKATIHVERESQKGMLIGRGGRMLKGIGSLARKDIEKLIGAPVFLGLWVKVEKNWSKRPEVLKRFGYARRGGRER